MASPMRSTDFRDIVAPILNEEFDGVYDQRQDEWSKFAREFNLQCPGFETDIHGLVEEVGPDGMKRYYADCVKA